MKNYVTILFMAFALFGLTACDDGGSSNNRRNYCYNNGINQGFQQNRFIGNQQYIGQPYVGNQQIVGYDNLGRPIYNNNNYYGGNQFNQFNQFDRFGNPINGANCGAFVNGNNAYAVRYDCFTRQIDNVYGRCDINGNFIY